MDAVNADLHGLRVAVDVDPNVGVRGRCGDRDESRGQDHPKRISHVTLSSVA